jgi:DNA-binding HxlR family transcriptional regulator
MVGDRWALLVMRELLWARRFRISARPTGISANVLKQRLDELEARGLLNKSGVRRRPAR